MIIRALTTSGDWQFGQGTESYNFNAAAVAENIQTRILSFLGNCWWDTNAGIDWFTYFGSPGKQQQTVLSVQAVILASYGVTKVNSVTLNLNDFTRAAVLTYNINSIYSSNYSQQIQVINPN